MSAAEKPYSPISDSEINPHIAAVVLNFFDRPGGYRGSSGEEQLVRTASMIDPYLQRVLAGVEPGGFLGLVRAVNIGKADHRSLLSIIEAERRRAEREPS